MNITEYNQYIERYLNSKNTTGALMLTSSWGRGKSFYVDNYLSKFLGDKCVKVSLYGLKSLDDISKSIYLDSRFKNIRRKNEALSYLKLIGKTISRGILSFFNVNIDPKEKDVQNLFKSIDLSKKLIVLEDVERSSIDIVQILGYVNNLCEQEKYKVLLVVNEEEILRDKEKAMVYSRIKEKTIIDTLFFDCPVDEPIRHILMSFAYLNKNGVIDKSKEQDSNFKNLLEGKSGYKEKEIVDIIKEIMQDDANSHHGNGYNLRSLIFACQKTIDFFSEAKKCSIEYNDAFFTTCLFGLIAFSFKFKRENLHTLKWDNDLDSPELLGHEKYPLLKVCFDYIQNQKFNKEYFIKVKDNIYLLNQKDESWRKLNDYLKYSYDEFLGTISIIQKLIKKEIFPLESYGTIASQLFSIKANIGDDNGKISSLINLIKVKLEETEYHTYVLYDKVINPSKEVLLTNDAKNEYEKFKNDISHILIQKATKELIDLTKTKNGIKQFCRVVESYVRESSSLLNKIKTEFVSMINIAHMVELLLICSPDVIADFAIGFLKIYNIGNDIDRVMENLSAERSAIGNSEINAIKEMIQKLEEVVAKQQDKICCYQIKLFIEELKKIK